MFWDSGIWLVATSNKSCAPLTGAHSRGGLQSYSTNVKQLRKKEGCTLGETALKKFNLDFFLILTGRYSHNALEITVKCSE